MPHFQTNLQQYFRSPKQSKPPESSQKYPRIMTTQQKGTRQPLGTIEAINKVISGIPPNLALQQTRNLKIIYAKKKLEVDIPVKWTINKVKCMLCTQFQILNFDKFQFQCNKMLIPGKTQVGHLPDDELIVTKADCPEAFNKFYNKTVTQVIRKYNINTQSTVLPILNKDFSLAMIQNLPAGRLKNIEQLPENRNQRRQEEDGVIVINLLRVIGLAFMANIIFSFASYWQIGVLVFILCLYYFIDGYVKENERRRTRAQRQAQIREEEENKRKEDERKRNETDKNADQVEEQQKPNLELKRQQKQVLVQRKIYQLSEQPIQEKEFKRKEFETNEQSQTIQEENTEKQAEQPKMMIRPKILIVRAKFQIWMAFFTEAIYCYILSIFPNWTVQTHLHANQETMDRVMDQVKRIDPEASEQIKKWEIKYQLPQNQTQKKQYYEEAKKEEEQINE